MKLAIVEDLISERLKIIKYIRHYFDKIDMPLCITEFESGEEFLRELKPGLFDLVFMDIIMNGITGMDTAKQLYAQDKKCTIIFLTTSRDYAIEGYTVNAFRYFIKPITYQKLAEVMDLYLHEIALDRKKLSVIVNRIPTDVFYKDILYVDVLGRIVQIHLQDMVLPVSRNFNEIGDILLQDKRFIVCFRGIVVNMAHIDGVKDENFIMRNGDAVPIRRRGIREIKKTFLSFQINDVEE